MNWFKNFNAYALDLANLPRDYEGTPLITSSALEEKQFTPISGSEAKSTGFVKPSSDDAYLREYQGAYLVALRTDAKVLPASVIKQHAAKFISDLEYHENRKIGRREKKEILELTALNLLPQAFTKTTVQRAVIDTKAGLIYVEGSSASKAEEMLAALREALGSLPARLVETGFAPQSILTLWVEGGECADNFALDASCELRFPCEGGAVAKFKDQALETDDVQNNLKSGKIVTKLGLIHKDRVSFTITDALEFRKVAMLDVLHDELEELEPEDADALFDASLSILVGELRDLVPAVIDAMGGMEE